MMDYRYAQWANEEHTAVTCEIQHPTLGWIPFTATEDDPAETSKALFEVLDPDTVASYQQPSLEAWRATLQCTPLQGKIALGEDRWAKAEEILHSPDTPWAMKASITSASVWRRGSPTMDELIWALDMTPEEADDLFVLASTIQV